MPVMYYDVQALSLGIKYSLRDPILSQLLCMSLGAAI